MTPRQITLVQDSFAMIVPKREEVARGFYDNLFLLDPARSAFVNGHALAVDGGFSGAGLLR